VRRTPPTSNSAAADAADDPSFHLAPKSQAFLRNLRINPRITLEYLDNCELVEAASAPFGKFVARLRSTVDPSNLFETDMVDFPIVLCTGYVPANAISNLIPFKDSIYPDLDPSCDESVSSPNCFLVGPSVRYPGAAVGCPSDVLLCYVYKFRTRFAIIAAEIVSRIIQDYYIDEDGNLDEEGAEVFEGLQAMERIYRAKGMWMDDLAKAKCGEIEKGISGC
jgi:hypothetical protein